MPVVKVVQMIQATFPDLGLMANIRKISALKLKNVCFWPYSEKRFSDIDHETKIWNSNLDHLEQRTKGIFFSDEFFFDFPYLWRKIHLKIRQPFFKRISHKFF